MKNPVQYTAGWKYQVFSDHSVQTPITGHHVIMEFSELEPDGMLTIHTGAVWNGPDVVPDVKSFMRSSLYHDIFYVMMAKKLLPLDCKKAVDKFMLDVCVEDGMWRWVARIMYRGVRLNPRPDEKPVLTT